MDVKELAEVIVRLTVVMLVAAVLAIVPHNVELIVQVNVLALAEQGAAVV